MPGTPLTPEEARHAARTFSHRRTWVCRCGATLTVRARDSRADGPSNYQVCPPDFPIVRMRGHSLLPSGDLTWNGLAAERGWESDPVRCPACQRGMTVSDYRVAKRAGAALLGG